jgi:hypothetical protein
MRKIYITTPVPVVDVSQGLVKSVVEVDPEVVYRLWARFLRDVDAIARSVHEALQSRGSKCLNDLACKLRLISDLIVAYIKRLVIVPPLPPPKGTMARYVWHPQDLLVFYVVLKSYCTYSGDDPICGSIYRVLEGLLTSNRSKDAPGLEDLPAHYEYLSRAVESLKAIIGARAFDIIFNSLEALEEDHLKVCRDDSVYRLGLLRCVPADTRPGLNTSALVIHSILTSAIAYIAHIERAKHAPAWLVEASRLASLLHDVGKPLAWYRTFKMGEYVSHVDDSVLAEAWRSLEGLGSLLGSEAWGVVKALVKCHHAEEAKSCIERELSRQGISLAPGTLKDLVEVLECIILGDRVSSNVDRVLERVKEALGEVSRSLKIDRRELEAAYTSAYVRGVEAWRWWLSRSDEEVEKISTIIAEKVVSEEAQMVSAARELGRAGAVKPLTYVGVVDIRGIQRYISREALRALVGGSIAVDVVTLAVVPALLVSHLHLNLEHALYAGGGMVEALLPPQGDGRGSIKSLCDRYNELRRRATWLPEVTCAEVELLSDWSATSRNLVAKLASEKLMAAPARRDRLSLVELGIGVPCEACGTLAAKKREEAGRELLCDVCKALWSFGESFYVLSKLEVLESAGYTEAKKLVEGPGTIMEYLMEWLSGAPGWSRGEGATISVIKADMNLGGLFMANSLSMSEAFTKSALIDYALKKSLYTALKAVAKTYGDDALMRAYVGILYAGGDDLLAIVPAGVAPLFALYTAVTFWSVIGSRQLSIAIGGAKPRQNVWNVIDTVSRFLDSCKDHLRAEVSGLKDLRRVVGVLYFVYSERQLLPAFKDVVENYKSAGLSVQPLLIRVVESPGFPFDAGLNSATHLLSLFTPEEVGSVGSVLSRVGVLRLEPKLAGEVVDYVKEVYGVVRAKTRGVEEFVLGVAVYSANYAMRARRSEDSVTRAFGEKLAEYLKPALLELERRKAFPLYDLYTLAKFVEEAKHFTR